MKKVLFALFLIIFGACTTDSVKTESFNSDDSGHVQGSVSLIQVSSKDSVPKDWGVAFSILYNRCGPEFLYNNFMRDPFGFGENGRIGKYTPSLVKGHILNSVDSTLVEKNGIEYWRLNFGSDKMLIPVTGIGVRDFDLTKFSNPMLPNFNFGDSVEEFVESFFFKSQMVADCLKNFSFVSDSSFLVWLKVGLVEKINEKEIYEVDEGCTIYRIKFRKQRIVSVHTSYGEIDCD